MQIIITHPRLDGAQAVIAEESFPEFGEVGWVKVGPASDAEDDAAASRKKAKATVPAADPAPESVPADDTKKEL